MRRIFIAFVSVARVSELTKKKHVKKSDKKIRPKIFFVFVAAKNFFEAQSAININFMHYTRICTSVG
jgi:hypothetical protein